MKKLIFSIKKLYKGCKVDIYDLFLYLSCYAKQRNSKD